MKYFQRISDDFPKKNQSKKTHLLQVQLVSFPNKPMRCPAALLQKKSAMWHSFTLQLEGFVFFTLQQGQFAPKVYSGATRLEVSSWESVSLFLAIWLCKVSNLLFGCAICLQFPRIFILSGVDWVPPELAQSRIPMPAKLQPYNQEEQLGRAF